MKLPTKVLSHCLAHGTTITPRKLRKILVADQRLGYGGMVILPALIPDSISPKDIAQVFQETKMNILVCGFIPGDGPSPYIQPKLVLKSLQRQASYAAEFANKGLGPAVLAGPLHTHHGKPLPKDWSRGKLRTWLDEVETLLQCFSLRALYEPLNEREDKTPQPFQTLHQLIRTRNWSSGLHYDTGHAQTRGINLAGKFHDLAPKIGFFEFANVGRWPLAESKGILFGSYANAMTDLPDNCLVGVEPFDPKVIQAFGLKKLCDTTVSGEKALAQDAKFLQDLGVMEKIGPFGPRRRKVAK